jgi:hypothetical protein
LVCVGAYTPTYTNFSIYFYFSLRKL